MADRTDEIEDFEHIGPQYRLRASAIERAVAAERERCAKIAENKGAELHEAAIGRFVADAIRANSPKG